MDPEGDCQDTNSQVAGCFALLDVVLVNATCTGPNIDVGVQTVDGCDMMDPGATLRTGCTISGPDAGDSLEFRCWSSNLTGNIWADERPPTVNGEDVAVDAGEGCSVVGDELHMVLHSGKVPFPPTTVACSTAHSTGPGTTINDFVPAFDFDPSCTFD